MVLLGAVLVPVGGIFLAHFVVMRKGVNVGAVYSIETMPSFNIAGVAAWILGFIVYKLATRLAPRSRTGTSIVVYLLLHRIHIDVTRVKP